MSKRDQRNAYYSSLDFPYQRYQTPYSGADGAPSLAEKRAQRNFYYDNLDYPYQKEQKEYSNISGPPKGIEEKRDVRNAYYNALPDPYRRYPHGYMDPNMPLQYIQVAEPVYIDTNAAYYDPNAGLGNMSTPDMNAPAYAPDSLQSISLSNQQAESGTGETLAQQQQDFYLAEGPADFVKSHAKLIGGIALTSVAAFTVWFVWLRK